MMKVVEAISKITRHTVFLSQLVFHLDLGIFYFQIDIKKTPITFARMEKAWVLLEQYLVGCLCLCVMKIRCCEEDCGVSRVVS